MSTEHVLIDGYNLLHAHPEYAAAAKADLDAARARLVADLAGFAAGGPRTIVVFDGGGNPASDGTPHHIGSLTVIFSPSGATADETIEGLAARFRDRGQRVLVVTTDKATRETVRSGSVSVLPSARFAADLIEEVETRRHVTAPRRRVPVSRRIDPDVADTLARWARGRTQQPEKESHKD